jgi:hypothetical protein
MIDWLVDTLNDLLIDNHLTEGLTKHATNKFSKRNSNEINHMISYFCEIRPNIVLRYCMFESSLIAFLSRIRRYNVLL